MNNFEKLNLYPHNIETVKKIIETYEEGIDAAAAIQATGTGKSYVGLAMALEYKYKKTIWVVPTNAIKEHIEETIKNNPNLSFEIDFPNLEIRTYQSFVNMSREELENLECDFLIIDEIQHLTAPVWGERMEYIKNTHPNMIKLGLTAYTTNYRGTIYERDVTNPDTDEIFSDAVVSEYDLYDAIIDGILPKPIVKSVITEESEIITEIKEKIAILKNKGDKSYLEYQRILDDVIRMIHKQNGVKELIQQTIKPDGKYIYFCPLYYETGKNDMNTIMATMKKYIKEKYPDKKVVFYKTTSADGEKGRYNRECFYNDIDLEGEIAKDCIRIMFAINQYNEGVHAPNVDGVFLGRRTRSDIVAFEQIGRALSVRGDTYKKVEEYNKYSIEELKQLATERGISVDENTSKEQLIELLISPIIIDLADNIELFQELETNLIDRNKEIEGKTNDSIKEKNGRDNNRRRMANTRINISVINKDLLLVLQKMRANLMRRTWDNIYNLLVAYYNKYGNSDVLQRFITVDGITPAVNGEEGAVALGKWCDYQRQYQKNLSEEKKEKLKKVNFRYTNKVELEWEKKYNLLVIYYNEYKNTEVPKDFVTTNGITKSEKNEKGAVALGHWCVKQRLKYSRLTEEKKLKLKKINFRIEYKDELEWKRKYDLLVAYYNKYGNADVPHSFVTVDGINISNKVENGAVALGVWCANQRTNHNKLLPERKLKLESIGFRFVTKKEHRSKIEELCNKYNLDYKKNKFLLKMSYQELYAKIEYLLDNNLPLQIDGEINPIFSMSNANMQMQYGISKEEIITKYYLNSGKGL